MDITARYLSIAVDRPDEVARWRAWVAENAEHVEIEPYAGGGCGCCVELYLVRGESARLATLPAGLGLQVSQPDPGEADRCAEFAARRAARAAADPAVEHSANPGFALGQLGRALHTSGDHPDPEVRERARRRVESWARIFHEMLAGALAIGSRTPVAATPAWATLEVAAGGFATGRLLAGGPLLPHEEQLRARLGLPCDGTADRAALNAHYLGETGRDELRALLKSGHYRLSVPEEGALLAVAWLLEHDEADRARAVLDAIGPFLGRLRFYPERDPAPPPPSSLVHVETIAETLVGLDRMRPAEQVEAQRETLTVWNPLTDRLLALFAETVDGPLPHLCPDAEGRPARRADGAGRRVEGGWPCVRYAADWPARARALLAEAAALRAAHRRCRGPERAGSNLALLLEL
ncbi:MAG: hypothetical protein HZA54_07625, partial [Planctomycetes bacterium]|nr:hypothetical protein [Planctomycetota bacterium]